MESCMIRWMVWICGPPYRLESCPLCFNSRGVTPTGVRVRAYDHKIVSPGEFSLKDLKVWVDLSFLSKAVPILPAISYDGSDMIVITDMVLEHALYCRLGGDV